MRQQPSHPVEPSDDRIAAVPSVSPTGAGVPPITPGDGSGAPQQATPHQPYDQQVPPAYGHPVQDQGRAG